MDQRVAAILTGFMTVFGMLTLGGMDVEMISAIPAVLWRAEDVGPTPEWLPWVVYDGLIMVAAYQVTKWGAAFRRKGLS